MDAGDNAVCSTTYDHLLPGVGSGRFDQRGRGEDAEDSYWRVSPVGGVCDIGSYEHQVVEKEEREHVPASTPTPSPSPASSPTTEPADALDVSDGDSESGQNMARSLSCLGAASQSVTTGAQVPLTCVVTFGDGVLLCRQSSRSVSCSSPGLTRASDRLSRTRPQTQTERLQRRCIPAARAA